MSTEHTRFDIFISHARTDNARGWVTALRDRILEDQRGFSQEPLRIFLDMDEISDMDDWRLRILGALRQSKILLVGLSPSYLASEYCRWEWEEYTKRQADHRLGQDSIAVVYFVDVPGSDQAENAWWREAVFKKEFTDIRPWFSEGARALEREEVLHRMATLGQSLWKRIQRARRFERAPGNLRRSTPCFVGRSEELRQLHKELATGKVGLVTAVHGLGGQGKTELAVAYGHAFADSYPAGLWLVGAEGRQELLPLIGELAYAPELGYRPSQAELADAALLGRGVLAELGRRAHQAQERDPDGARAALVILDNVSEPGLFSSAELAKLPRADWLRVLATTRLGTEQLASRGGSLAFVEVGSLPEEVALTLVREHQPARDPKGLVPGFASPADEDAARDIVRELGGLTLAVEQVAVYLGLHPEISPSALLAGLRERGLSSTDRVGADQDVQAGMLHQQKRLSAVLEETLAPLDEPARTALAYAALLPPECVPWPWLRQLTIMRHPEVGDHASDEPDPWITVRRRLEGLRLIVARETQETGRMHRLVAAHVANTIRGSRTRRELESHVAARARALCRAQRLDEPWELDALLAVVPLMLGAPDVEGDVADASVFLTDKVTAYRSVPAAMALLGVIQPVLKQLARAAPSNAQWQWDLSVSHDKLGDALRAQGDLGGALRAYRESLAISQIMTQVAPSAAQWRRQLSVGLIRVGDALHAQGDLGGALRAYRESLAISQIMTQVAPSNAVCQEDLSASLDRVGDVLRAQGHLGGALKVYQESLAVRQKLAKTDPSNAGWQRALSLSRNKLGDVLLAQGHLGGALKAYRESLAVRQTLVQADPSNTEWQRDLSVSHDKLGDVLLAQGDLRGALNAYRESLVVSRELAKADPSNESWQCDLGRSHVAVGDILLAQRDLDGALEAYSASLLVRQRLAGVDPANTGWQRDLSVSHSKVGDVRVAQGDLRGALKAYRETLRVSQRLVGADPSNTGWQRDLSVSWERLGDVLVAQGDLRGALDAYRESLTVRQSLARLDPSNAVWQRDLWVTYWRMAQTAERAETADPAEWWRKAYEQLSAMKRRGLSLSPADEQSYQQLAKRLRGSGFASTPGILLAPPTRTMGSFAGSPRRPRLPVPPREKSPDAT